MRSLDYVRSARTAAVLALALSILPTCGATAQQRVPWVVVESHGDVTQQTVDGMLPLAPGATLAEGAPIRTGADGALVIAHGNDRATVSANSAFVLPKGVDPATGPSILETLGTLLFKVEHTPGRRFEVDTPYLAAVVKGTVFTVTVDGAEHIVHVAEGAVEVTALASHAAVLVKPGQTATLSSPSGTPSVIDGAAPAGGPGSTAPRTDKRSDATRAPVSTAPRKAAQSDNAAQSGAVRLTRTLGDVPLDVAALTNGLVKAGKDLSLLNGVLAPLDAVAAVPGTLGVSVGTGSSTVATGSSPATQSTVASPAPAAGGGTPAPGPNLTTPIATLTAPIASAVAPLAAPVQPILKGAIGPLAPITAGLLGANNPPLTGRKP